MADVLKHLVGTHAELLRRHGTLSSIKLITYLHIDGSNLYAFGKLRAIKFTSHNLELWYNVK